MNEPHEQIPLEWVKTSNAVAAAIRATGATNKIIFQGSAWDGAWSWTTSGNAVEMLKAYDPGNNYAFEAHQYLEVDNSGTSPICVSGSGAARLAPIYDMAAEVRAARHHWRGWMGCESRLHKGGKRSS
jgi:endoglucanase